MDVRTGDIKAISNLEKSKTAGQGYIEGMNRAVLGYEPGSVIKTLSMMIAIEDGIVRPTDVLSTGASYAYAGGRAISDSHGVGSMTVAEVIERSSNIGMTKIITKNTTAVRATFTPASRPPDFLSRSIPASPASAPLASTLCPTIVAAASPSRVNATAMPPRSPSLHPLDI